MEIVSAARVLRERREEGSRRRRCDGKLELVVKDLAVRAPGCPDFRPSARLMTTIRPSRPHRSGKARRLRPCMHPVYLAKS